MNPLMEILRERFAKLWTEHVDLDGQCDGDTVFMDLWIKYSQDHRWYHNIHHIDSCLKEMDNHLPKMKADGPIKQGIIEMALWFHDAVYKVDQGPSGSNESDSAALFLTQTEGRGHVYFLTHTVGAILATRHNGDPLGLTPSFVVDIDLASLGYPWETFFQNTCNIRKEMPNVSEEDFWRGQSSFLKSKFLDSARIYRNPVFRGLYEEQARANIEKLVTMCSGGTPS